jgi:transcriptional regulator with XRE-family HTH domain
MTTSETLRDLRRRSGLTQAVVAERVGVAPSVVSAYEHGRREPLAEVFLALVRANGFDPRWSARLDDHVQAHRLVQVLHLAEALPFVARPLASARID